MLLPYKNRIELDWLLDENQHCQAKLFFVDSSGFFLPCLWQLSSSAPPLRHLNTLLGVVLNSFQGYILRTWITCLRMSSSVLAANHKRTVKISVAKSLWTRWLFWRCYRYVVNSELTTIIVQKNGIKEPLGLAKINCNRCAELWATGTGAWGTSTIQVVLVHPNLSRLQTWLAKHKCHRRAGFCAVRNDAWWTRAYSLFYCPLT